MSSDHDLHATATAGAVIFAGNLERVSTFYSTLLLAPAIRAAGFSIIESGGIRLTIHAIPAVIAAQFPVETPPVRREEAAIKLSFPVHSLQHARLQANDCGGVIDDNAWEFDGRRYADGHDPEGNVVQFHEGIE